MRKILYFILVLPLIGLLAGCATRQPYQSPVSGPTAGVTFYGKGLVGGFLTTTSLDFYIDPCDHKQQGWVYLNKGINSQHVRVLADRPIQIHMSFYYDNGAYTQTGDTYLTFLPRSGRDYSVTFSQMGNKYRVAVARVDKATGATYPVRTHFGQNEVASLMQVFCPVKKGKTK